MGRNSKIGLWMAGGLVVLALILLTVRLVKDLPYKRQIPMISDLQNLPRPLHEQIETTLKKAKPHPSAGNLGMLGMVYHANAFYDLAGECYALAIKRKSTEWIWNYYLGYLDRELSESQAALENFNAVTKKNPGMDMAWFYAGEEYQNSGNNQQAELAFKKLVASGKNQPTGNTGTR
jgi:tetratricopeptide (TPR) repeat protein